MAVPLRSIFRIEPGSVGVDRLAAGVHWIGGSVSGACSRPSVVSGCVTLRIAGLLSAELRIVALRPVFTDGFNDGDGAGGGGEQVYAGL